MNKKLVSELIRRVELRKRMLLGEVNLGYELHRGHHLRDVMTVLAVLKGHPDAERLVKNLPELPSPREEEEILPPCTC